jgi:hypothetical protein
VASPCYKVGVASLHRPSVSRCVIGVEAHTHRDVRYAALIGYQWGGSDWQVAAALLRRHFAVRVANDAQVLLVRMLLSSG